VIIELLIGVLVLGLFFWNKPKNLPPLAGKLPIAGAGLDWLRDPIQMVTKNYKRFGDIWVFNTCGIRMHILGICGFR
jgi:hypothetical protein